jgi:thiamine-phosphate pyrophosphorylase
LLPAAKTPIVCYVTDRTAFAAETSARTVLERIRAAAQAGADWIQIREKDLSGAELLALVRDAVELVRSLGARIIVNDRLDVAQAAGAHGVHLGRASLPAADVARWRRDQNAPTDYLLGVSCHSLSEARDAEATGASYIFFGPVFDTPSKRAFGAPQGAAKLSEVCAAVEIPVIAIGGVNVGNAIECLKSGATGVAAVREFQGRTDVGRARKFVEAVKAKR